jgi:hypothetical protein
MVEDRIKLTYLAVPGSGHSVLRHEMNEKGKLTGVVSVGIIGFLIDSDGDVLALQTATGREAATSAVMGPDGEVTREGMLFCSVEDYCEWFIDNCH